MPEPIVTLSGGSPGPDLREPVRRAVEDALGGPPEAEALAVADEPERSGLREAAGVVGDGCAEMLAHAGPLAGAGGVGADNAIGRLSREMRRRTRVVGAFPDGGSAPTPVAAGLECVAEGEWGSRRYLDVTLPEG